MKAHQRVFLSVEWSGKLQALLETHALIPKLQPMRGPVKPSDAADPLDLVPPTVVTSSWYLVLRI